MLDPLTILPFGCQMPRLPRSEPNIAHVSSPALGRQLQAAPDGLGTSPRLGIVLDVRVDGRARHDA